MGKMKQLFIEMQEEAAQEARDQVGMHVPEEPIMTSNKVPAIPCPNCNKGYLWFNWKTSEANCSECGQDFVHVENNTIKFK
tara:strand:+ start:1405 stop:1647 length:243 start_codon:yes stop_codon:yes gene_type:complete